MNLDPNSLMSRHSIRGCRSRGPFWTRNFFEVTGGTVEGKRMNVKDLGALQKKVWTLIGEATQRGDGSALRRYGQVADEMDRNHDRWSGMIDNNPASITDTAPETTTPDATTRKIPIRPGDHFEIPDEGMHFETFERDLILQAMEKSDWVIARASKMLGMSYRTLQYRLDKFNLKKPEGP